MPTLHAFFLPQVMYFSSLFPYVVLVCFLVRGLLLRGAVDGIMHMFTPKVRTQQTPSRFSSGLLTLCAHHFTKSSFSPVSTPKNRPQRSQ